MIKNKKAHKKHSNLLPLCVSMQSSYKQDVFKDLLTEINNSNLFLILLFIHMQYSLLADSGHGV
jgi:hypothetical protein